MDAIEAKREAKRLYDKARYPKKYIPKKTGIIRSRYRFKNGGERGAITVHKIIAEKVLGHTIPEGAEVHHVDGNGHNNAHSNLVICPDHAYHMLLHIRQRALEECGNADWLRCIRCKRYDDPKNMHLYTPKDQTSPRAEHRECRRKMKGGVI